MMKSIYVFLAVLIFSCAAQINPDNETASDPNPAAETDSPKPSCLRNLRPDFKTGAEQMDKVVALLEGKKVGLVGNPSSQVDGVHMVDSLLGRGVALQRIFCPEHGFRGEAAAGDKVTNSIDEQTGLPIISLYGNSKKPKVSDFSDLDVIVFDIQDVGARFYTYISTLHYVMESAAEAGVPVLVLDRPNPNGHYVDGPVLDKKFSSFIGMHPVPVVHGMTIGEYAQMINGEGWLNKGVTCELTVVPCLNYTHDTRYSPPVKPSPNLPNENSVYLYPSLCFFEGTAVSVGRGTDTPFQMYGHPALKLNSFSFTPESRSEAPDPKLKGKKCFGLFYTNEMVEMANNGRIYGENSESLCDTKLLLKPLLEAYSELEPKESFFTRPDFFDLLAGTDKLRLQITKGKTEEEIRASWSSGLEKYKKMSSNYVIYP